MTLEELINRYDREILVTLVKTLRRYYSIDQFFIEVKTGIKDIYDKNKILFISDNSNRYSWSYITTTMLPGYREYLIISQWDTFSSAFYNGILPKKKKLCPESLESFNKVEAYIKDWNSSNQDLSFIFDLNDVTMDELWEEWTEERYLLDKLNPRDYCLLNGLLSDELINFYLFHLTSERYCGIFKNLIDITGLWLIDRKFKGPNTTSLDYSAKTIDKLPGKLVSSALLVAGYSVDQIHHILKYRSDSAYGASLVGNLARMKGALGTIEPHLPGKDVMGVRTLLGLVGAVYDFLREGSPLPMSFPLLPIWYDDFRFIDRDGVPTWKELLDSLKHTLGEYRDELFMVEKHASIIDDVSSRLNMDGGPWPEFPQIQIT